ncbi:hypothetical protein [Acidisoma sp. 7E03]
MGFVPGDGGDALHENGLRFVALLGEHRFNDLRRLGFEKPRFRRKSLRFSSLRVTILSRAALMPSTKGRGEDLAKRVRAGAGSCANREAVDFR